MRSRSIIVISSKKEYLESAWVESEWQRWINFINKDVKEKNSLYLYIPNGQHYELPTQLQRTQKFSDTLELVNRVDEIYHPVKVIEKIDIEELLEKAENNLFLEKIEKAQGIYEQLINEYPKDYRPWLGLIKVLEEEGISLSDKRYKNFINRALSLCEDNKIKTSIEKEYNKYLEEKKIPVVEQKEEKKNATNVVNTPTTEKVIKKYSEELEYTINDENNGYILTGIGTCEDTDIIIPSTYQGLPVVSIEDSAFYECTSLASIEIPNSVTSIGNYAFHSGGSLISIEVDSNNEYYKSIDGVLYSKDGTTLIRYPEGKKETTFVIPSSVTSIGDNAFACCASLASIEIPNSVTSIGDSAFSYCTSLTSITIPNGVTSIVFNAFYNCDSLTNIEVDENNEYYKSIDGVLYSKDGTTLIKYPGGKEDTTFVIPTGVTTIFTNACHSFLLKRVTIPSSVTRTGGCLFSYSNSLTIYCEANSERSGWSIFWNAYNCPVVWGYKK